MDAIKKAIKLSKDIVCSMILDDSDKSELRQLCEENKVKIDFLDSKILYNLAHKKIEENLVFSQNKCPVICVGNMTSNLESYEIALGLIARLKNDGYKVSGILCEKTCEFFGYHDYFSLFENLSGRSYTSDVLWLNNVETVIEDIEKPDVIIVELPYCMIKFDDNIYGDFGMSAYMISQAMNIDYFICCSNYEQYYQNEDFDELSKDFYYRFGYNIDAISISNKCVLKDDIIDRRGFYYTHKSYIKTQEIIDKLNETANIPVYNLCDDEQLDIMYKNMIDSF